MWRTWPILINWMFYWFGLLFMHSKKYRSRRSFIALMFDKRLMFEEVLFTEFIWYTCVWWTSYIQRSILIFYMNLLCLFLKKFQFMISFLCLRYHVYWKLPFMLFRWNIFSVLVCSLIRLVIHQVKLIIKILYNFP